MEAEEASLQDARFRLPPVRRRSGGRVLPSVSPAHVGHHGQIRRSGHTVSPGEVPAGGRYVRLHLHDRGDDHRPIPGDLQPHGDFSEEESALERSGVRRLVRLLHRRPPAGFHLLPGRDRSRGLRLLG